MSLDLALPLVGRFTSVACMANTQPVNDNSYVTAFILEKAKAVGSCRVFPIGAVTRALKGGRARRNWRNGIRGRNALLVTMECPSILNSYLMRKAMDYSKAFGIPIISHAEDWNLVWQGAMMKALFQMNWDYEEAAAAEEIMVAREIALCRLTRAPIHIAHISTEVALEHLRRAKDAGLPVTAEASPHHSILPRKRACAITPPIAKWLPPFDQNGTEMPFEKQLQKDIVEIIATDHVRLMEWSIKQSSLIKLQMESSDCKRRYP